MTPTTINSLLPCNRRLLFLLLTLLLITALSASSQSLDSLKLPTTPNFQIQTDTLFDDQLLQAEQTAAKYTHKIDSLQSLNLPTEKYRNKLDSISAKIKNKIVVTRTIDSAKLQLRDRTAGIRYVHDSITNKLESRRLALQEKIDRKTGFLDSLTNRLGVSKIDRSIPGGNKLPDMQLQSHDINLPGLTKPDIDLPRNLIADKNLDANSKIKVDNPLNDVKEKISDIHNNDVKKKVNDVKNELQEANEVLKKADTYKKEVGEIKENGLGNAENLTKEAEQQATRQIMKQDAMKDLQTQDQQIKTAKNSIAQYRDMLAAARDKSKAADAAKKIATESNLVKNFTGNEEKIEAAAAQLDKLKKKYKNIPDSRYLPKRAPNEMKGKPFRERIVLGSSFQVFKAGSTVVDFAPYVAYKLTGRFRPGVGMSWRAAVWLKDPWIKEDEVFGFRAFNGFRLYGTFYFHTEGEWLNYSQAAKARYRFPVDKEFDDWRFKFNTGLFRTYSINKRINGQFQVLYNVADLTRFPQTRNTSIRFGFEYKFQPKKKKPASKT